MTIPLVQQLVAAAKAQDLAKFKQIGAQVVALNATNSQIAASLGVKDCANGIGGDTTPRTHLGRSWRRRWLGPAPH